MRSTTAQPINDREKLEQASPTAHVEIDRFCDGCGYNLRTQPVRRDERTEILIVRCPECGRFAPAANGVTAARPWLHRLATLLLFGWALFLLWAVVMLSIAQGALTFVRLEDFTTWQPAATASAPASATTSAPAAAAASASSVQLVPLPPVAPPNARVFITRPGSTTTYYQRAPRTLDQTDRYVLAAVLSICTLIGFATALIIVVAMHHWRRPFYFLPVFLIPTIIATFVYLAWSSDAPHLASWGLPFILAHTACYIGGGLVGIFFGRPFARTLVCVLLPPRVRPALSFLWLADHKPLPKPA